MVSELDVILRQRLCSKSQLIRAIERQLDIQLGTGCEGSKGEHDDYEGSKGKDEDCEDSKGEDEDIRKPRSGTMICHDDSDENEAPHTPSHSPPQSHTPTLHPRTHSSPQLSRKVVSHHPQPSSPVAITMNIDDSHIDNNTIGCHDNISPSNARSRCYSNACDSSPLKRTNAKKRRTTTSACDKVGGVSSKVGGVMFSDGHGVFTQQGGSLTKLVRWLV